MNTMYLTGYVKYKVNEKERKKLKIFMMAIFLQYSSFFGHFFIRDILINCVHIKKKRVMCYFRF